MIRAPRLERQISEVALAVTRLDAKIDGNTKVAEAVTATQLASLQSVDRQVSKVEVEVDSVRTQAAAALETHVHAVNPHPQQEQWLREHLAAQGREITTHAQEMRALVGDIRSQIDTWRGSLKVMGMVYGAGIAVITGVVVKVLGG